MSVSFSFPSFSHSFQREPMLRGQAVRCCPVVVEPGERQGEGRGGGEGGRRTWRLEVSVVLVQPVVVVVGPAVESEQDLKMGEVLGGQGVLVLGI